MSDAAARGKKKYNFHKQGAPGRGGGGGRGGPRGRGGRGGRGGGRGGFSGGVDRPEGSEGGEKQSHLGRYRDDPLPVMLMDTGILATAVQNKERSAERELMECLERVADELYPETAQAEANADDEDLDMEAMLKRELEGLSGDQKSKRFRLCEHETMCVFQVVVLAPLDPTRLIRHILEETERTARCPFRYLRRIVPITAVGNATAAALKAEAKPTIESGFQSPDDQGYKYGVIANRRSSNKMESMQMITALADVVAETSSKHKVDLKDQERTILVELHRNRIGVSVVQDYVRFAKYNPFELAQRWASKNNAQKQSTEDADKSRVSDAKLANRERKAESIAAAYKDKEPESTKRKVNDEEGKRAEVTDANDVEAGEVLEGGKGDALDGSEWEEIIQDGKVIKMRRVEGGGGQ